MLMVANFRSSINIQHQRRIYRYWRLKYTERIEQQQLATIAVHQIIRSPFITHWKKMSNMVNIP